MAAACEVLAISSSWWSITGLLADFVGVILLGLDVFRIQRRLKHTAQEDRDRLDDMASEYGGVASWAEEIRREAEWIPMEAYWRYSADDPISFNARKTIERVKDLSDCVQGLAEHLAKLVHLHDQQVKRSAESAGTSIRFSIIGLIIIGIGFALQIVGMLPC